MNNTQQKVKDSKQHRQLRERHAERMMAVDKYKAGKISIEELVNIVMK